MKDKKIGHVYILASTNSDFIKIGGTDFPPMKRIREINSTKPYKEHGPWRLVDFRQVRDWRTIEASIHYAYRSKLVRSIRNQKELFDISLNAARRHLSRIDPEQIILRPRIDRMFQDENFTNYLLRLFSFTGLLNWLDIQGSWTFSLFPSTNGGRYFTINIGKHEVAFSRISTNDSFPIHMILMDRLILDFPKVKDWLKKYNGQAKEDYYNSALPRSVSLLFSGSFANILEFFELDGIRRAIIAYWSEALIHLKERETQSVYQRYHNWNAVAALKERLDRLK